MDFTAIRIAIGSKVFSFIELKNTEITKFFTLVKIKLFQLTLWIFVIL